jgi:hypothetical protein
MQQLTEARLDTGKGWERDIAIWLAAEHGYCVLPARSLNSDPRGPRLMAGDGDLIQPDLLVMSRRARAWCDVKYRTSWSLYRTTGKLQTGCDLAHFDDYARVQEATGIPAWLVFVQDVQEPTGVYWAPITRLLSNVRRDPTIRLDQPFGKAWFDRDALTWVASIGEVR